MDTLNDIFCFVMAGLFLPVGPACSGARTFIACQIIALFFCMSERWSWRMHAFAAIAALFANAVRCAILLAWICNDLPHYAVAHDVIGWTCVGCAYIAVVMYHPPKGGRHA